MKKDQPLLILDNEDYLQHIVSAQASIDYYKFLLDSEKSLYNLSDAITHVFSIILSD